MSLYYDIDDILMEEEMNVVDHKKIGSYYAEWFTPLISAVFQVSANGIGLLDPGSEMNRVEQGAKVDLPFWLTHELFLRQAVSINLSTCFNQKIRKEVQADAACVDLRSRCRYFYELGCKLVPMVGDRSIGSFLLYTFTGRYKEILSKAHSAAFAASPKFLPLLTREESHLFEAARFSMAAFKKWRVGGSRLERASVLGKKRKPVGQV